MIDLPIPRSAPEHNQTHGGASLMWEWVIWKTSILVDFSSFSPTSDFRRTRPGATKIRSKSTIQFPRGERGRTNIKKSDSPQKSCAVGESHFLRPANCMIFGVLEEYPN